MKDQQDCVLSDLQELGGKEFLLKIEYNTEIFSCSSSSCHDALPLLIRPMSRIHKMILKVSLSHLQQQPNPVLSPNCLWRKSLEEEEVTQKLSRLWLLQISSWQPSGYSKLEACRKGWLRSIVFERKNFESLLLSKFDVDPIHRVLMFLPYFFACTKQDAVLPSQYSQDLCVLYP